MLEGRGKGDRGRCEKRRDGEAEFHTEPGGNSLEAGGRELATAALLIIGRTLALAFALRWKARVGFEQRSDMISCTL